MRMKHFFVVLCVVIITTLFFVILGPTESNNSIKHIVSQTHEQLNKLQENLRASNTKTLEIDEKFLIILGFPIQKHFVEKLITETVPVTHTNLYKYYVQKKIEDNKDRISETLHELSLEELSLNKRKNSSLPILWNHTKDNFSIVTYARDDQLPLIILFLKHIFNKFPDKFLLIYDIDLSEGNSRMINGYCNTTRCSVIAYDWSVFPSYITNKRMHAYRPIIIRDALLRFQNILYLENHMRIRASSQEFAELQNRLLKVGVLGWNIPSAVSSRTHPKMFEYFHSVADNFYFLRMVELDAIFFSDKANINEKVLLPWLKCTLTLECLDPIGAQSNGCKFNKKPLYRYSGCHNYDTSALNIVLGLMWHLDDTEYSLPSDEYNNIFYKETLEQASKILTMPRNSSETPEHSFTED